MDLFIRTLGHSKPQQISAQSESRRHEITLYSIRRQNTPKTRVKCIYSFHWPEITIVSGLGSRLLHRIYARTTPGPEYYIWSPFDLFFSFLFLLGKSYLIFVANDNSTCTSFVPTKIQVVPIKLPIQLTMDSTWTDTDTRKTIHSSTFHFHLSSEDIHFNLFSFFVLCVCLH